MHPKTQAAGIAGVLQEVGWVQRVIVSQRTGCILDGHLRVALAQERGEPTIPVVYVDVAPDEERVILATLDPLSAMAEADGEKLRQLLDGVQPATEPLKDLLTQIAARERLVGPSPPELDADALAEEVEMVTCPECGHTFPK